MRLFPTFLLLLGFAAACDLEVHEVKEAQVEMFVPEERFRAVRAGMTSAQVVEAIGQPRQKKPDQLTQVWRYGVWRGESPGLLTMLFGGNQPVTLLEGTVVLRSGKVENVEVIESTARVFPPSRVEPQRPKSDS